MGLKFIKLENNRCTIESDLDDYTMAISELQSLGAKNFVRQAAADNGLHNPGINGTASTYPVDDTGKEIIHGQKNKIHRYRIDWPVVGSLR
jgi:hypothetical protein